jgi:predicted RNA binding protein YcfA (HicA-like mRNA interferase family)
MPGQLPRVTAAEMLRKLGRDGWVLARQGRRHIVLRHPRKAGEVIVPRHMSQVLKPGTTRSILNQARLTADEFRKL